MLQTANRMLSSLRQVPIMAVNNEVGTIQNVSRISEILSAHSILLHCDAAQAPCAMDIGDLARYADIISFSGHKMYGPQGIGALYIRRELQDSVEPLIHGGGQQNGLRSGTLPLPLCVGMGAAAEFVRGTMRRKNAPGSLVSATGSLIFSRTAVHRLS